MVDTIKDKFLQLIYKQGLAFMLIVIAIWYMKTDNDELRSQLAKNQDKIETYYKNDNAQMVKVIERNNEVMSRNNQIFEKYLNQK